MSENVCDDWKLLFLQIGLSTAKYISLFFALNLKAIMFKFYKNFCIFETRRIFVDELPQHWNNYLPFFIYHYYTFGINIFFYLLISLIDFYII